MSIYELTLKKKEIICDDVMVFDFESVDGNRVSFKPGQYINIYLDQKNGSVGHQGRSYSMIPTKNGVRIAVRLMGEFSTQLHNLDLGTKVTVDGPHGSLCPSNKQRSFVCIAGGIGIAPFVSWLDEFEQRVSLGEDIKVKFLISNSFKRRAPFLDKFSGLNDKGFMNTELFFTKENVEKSRRINLSDIENVVKSMLDADFVVCGSISFTRDMWKMLKVCGVPEERIFTEAFF